MNIPSLTNANIIKDMIFKNLQIEKEDTKQWDRNNVVNQSTWDVQNNHSTSKFLNHSLNSDMKKRTIPIVMECQRSGITIANLLFNVIMGKSEAAGKTNIQSIKKNTGAGSQDQRNEY